MLHSICFYIFLVASSPLEQQSAKVPLSPLATIGVQEAESRALNQVAGTVVFIALRKTNLGALEYFIRIMDIDGIHMVSLNAKTGEVSSVKLVAYYGESDQEHREKERQTQLKARSSTKDQ